MLREVFSVSAPFASSKKWKNIFKPVSFRKQSKKLIQSRNRELCDLEKQESAMGFRSLRVWNSGTSDGSSRKICDQTTTLEGGFIMKNYFPWKQIDWSQFLCELPPAKVNCYLKHFQLIFWFLNSLEGIARRNNKLSCAEWFIWGH